MRKLIWIPVIAVGAAWVLAQTSANQLVQNFGKALQEAQTLKATYTVLQSGGAPETYEIAFAKPDKARIETPKELIVADGKTVTTYDKASKTYWKDPQTPEVLPHLLRNEGLLLWAPFFDEKALSNVSARSLGSRNRKGMQLQAVEASFSGGQRTILYYLDDKSLARQAEVAYRDANDQRVIVDAKTIELGAAAEPQWFAFAAPAGARELTAEERSAGKWFENLDEAIAEARKTNKLLMLDFSAVW